MTQAEQISQAIATVERQISEAKSDTAKKVLAKKLERLKEDLKKAKPSLTTLPKARKTVKALNKSAFQELVEELSKKPEYAFLKNYSQERFLRDKARTAKPKGYRFKGDNDNIPTADQVKKGLKNGTVYYEGRPIRSDISREIRLKTGGKVSDVNIKSLEGNWNSYNKGVMSGKKDEGYVTIKNEEDLKDYITKKIGSVVKDIKVLEKGKSYPYNRSNPYFEDTYLVTLKNGSTFEVERSYGRPNWSGNVDYKEQISIKNRNNKYATGGGVEKGYNNPEKSTHVLHIDGFNWYLEKIDSTHFYMSNNPNSRGMAHHVDQHRGEPYYEEVRSWLKSTKFAKGGNIQFRKLAKSNNFDIIVSEGSFEVELDSNNKVKSIVHPSGERHKASECPIYQKYKKEINSYLTERFADGGGIEDFIIVDSYWSNKKDEIRSEKTFAEYIKNNPIKNVWIGLKKIDNYKFDVDDDTQRMIMRYALKKGASLKYYVSFLNHSVALKNNNAVFLQDKNYEDYDNKILTKETLELLNTRQYEEGGEVGDDETSTFVVMVHSELGDDQYTVEATDGVKAFQEARYLFKKENPQYRGNIDLSMLDKYAEGGNIDSSFIGTTRIGKGHYGWTAKTTTKKQINGYDWEITTMKRSSGDLVSSANGGKAEQKEGYSTFMYSPFEDPSLRLISSKPKMVNEKAVTKQHEEALKIFIEKLNEMKEDKMATGGTIFKKGDKVLLKDGGGQRVATISEDGVDSKNRVRVRPEGFPMDISVPMDEKSSNDKRTYVIKKLADGGMMATGGKVGEKTYNIMHNVGKSKYVVNFHNGEKTHSDGSPFFDIEIFKNLKGLKAFTKKLDSEGYKKQMATGGSLDKIKIGNDDFSFLLKLSDKELTQRLDLVRKQQSINGSQYMDARSKKEDTSKIEGAGERLGKQERAIIEARIRNNKMATGGSIKASDKKFKEVQDLGSEQYYTRYFGKFETEKGEIELMVVATIRDLEDYVSEDDLPEEGNFQLSFDIVPKEEFISEDLLEQANDEDSSAVSDDSLVNIVNYMGGLRYEPSEKVHFKTQEKALKHLMSIPLNKEINSNGEYPDNMIYSYYNRAGSTNEMYLDYMIGVSDKFFKEGGNVGKSKKNKYLYIPNQDISKIVLKSKQVIGKNRILDGAYVKSGKQKEKFTDKYKFPIGSVVWDKTHKTYGVVLNNYGDEVFGSHDEIRLDSDGNQNIHTYDKKWNNNGYNLVPYGSEEDKGDGDLTEAKESATRLIEMNSKRKQDAENKKYYEDAYKNLLSGKIDGKPFKVNSEKVIGETSTGKSIYQKYTSMPDLSYEELKEASDIHKKFSKKAKTEEEKQTALRYSSEFMRMANEEKFAKGLGKYAKGGGVDTDLHGKFGDDNPRLVNFDTDDLDDYEQMVYNDMKKSNTKASTLQVIINTVEGDYTQLSPKLAEIAEEQFTSDEWDEESNKRYFATGGKIDDAVEELWRGYASAILFAETDYETEEPLDYNYSISDFDEETEKDSKNLLRKFYTENKKAIEESGLDLYIIGNDIWYTRAGHGAGFFDHSLDSDVEDALTNGAKALGEHPDVETYDGKISVRGGRVFEYRKGGKITKEDALQEAIAMGVDFNKDFHAQSFGNELTELAKKVGYRKAPSSSGSTGRAFFYHLQKIYDKKKFATGGSIEKSNGIYEISVPYNFEYVVKDDFKFTEFLSKLLTKKWFGNGIWEVKLVKELFENNYSQKVIVEISAPNNFQYVIKDDFKFTEFLSKTLTKEWFGNGIWGVKEVSSYAKGGSVSQYIDGMTEAEILKATIVYDNGGETLDRYTVFAPDGSVYGMSDTASGVNQYVGDDSEIEKGSHLGKRLKTVPKGIKWAVLDRMKEEFADGGMMYAGGGSIYENMTEKEFLNQFFGANVFTENPSAYFDIKKLSSSNDAKVENFINELKKDGYSIKKKSYSDFTSVMGVKKMNKMARGGNTNYSYIEKDKIDRIVTNSGKEYGSNVILDGAYVTDRVRTPKMSRTQFEDDVYAYGSGGNLGKSLYVAYSSYFDYNAYDTNLITDTLKLIGAKNIRLERERPNFPEVVVFNGDKQKAREALNIAFDTETILIYEKDWRTSKFATGGTVGDYFYDTRKDKAFQVIMEDGDKMAIQYLDRSKSPIGKAETISKNEFEYYVQMGAWNKWKQEYATGGEITPEEREQGLKNYPKLNF